MKEPMLSNDKRQNVLTEDLVTCLYEGFTASAKISYPKYTKQDLGRMLRVIYDINGLSSDAKNYQGTVFADWNVPTALAPLIFPMISLSGGSNELSLVEWVNETEYEPFDEADVMEFTRKFYATYRMAAASTNLAEKLVAKVAVATYVSNLILNSERVSDGFVKGKFPIIANFDIFKEYAEGMRVILALQLYIDEVLKILK